MKRFIYIALTVVVLSVSSCGKWLDVNDNPNYVSQAEISSLLPTVELRLADKVGYDLALYGSFWSQYVNQCQSTNQYYTIMTYDVTNSSFTSPWSYLYAQILPGIKEIITTAEKNGYSNYVLEGKTLLAYSLYLLTSLYDDVAYSDGYLTDNLTPKFDTGEAMQAKLIALIEEIRAMDIDKAKLDESSYNSSDTDMIFAGDLDEWVGFANTLYLKVLLRDFNANKTAISELLAEDNFMSGNCSFDHFQDVASKSNPLYESDRRQLNTTDNIRACTDILGVLDAADPRLDYFYDKGGCVGAQYGVTTKPAASGRLRLGATDPVYFSTYDELLFLAAEACARLGEADTAKELYENAIKAVFERTDLGSADEWIVKYAFDSSASVEAQVEQIINQKWASFCRALPIEAWFDINRTGYPERGKTITSYVGVAGGYPYRFINSKTSLDYNPNAPKVKAVTEKMWWHK